MRELEKACPGHLNTGSKHPKKNGSLRPPRAKLKQAILYVERNPTMVKSITTFPYIRKSL
jgi:hypothetical protein